VAGKTERRSGIPRHARRLIEVFVEVEGAGAYLPKYAGNLDIETAAGVKVGEEFARPADASTQPEPLDPERQRVLEAVGFEPTSTPGDRFRRELSQEIKTWTEVVNRTSLKPR